MYHPAANPMAFDQAIAAWARDAPQLAAEWGIVAPEARAYLPDAFRRNFNLAMDAQPTLVTTSNTGVPAFLANYLDPKLIEILLTPNKAAQIVGEGKKGDWTTMTAMFPVVERTGEVSSYGDWNNNGSTGANTNFPQRQSYHYQTVTQWGEKQLDMAALAKIDWAAQLNIASAIVLDKFQNNSYFFGISGLQNYGLVNDPSLSAALTPASKAYGGVKWVNNGVVVATANEIFTDIQSIWLQLISVQTQGIIDENTPVTMALSPQSKVALTATNSFNVNVRALLKENFPNMTIEDATQYNVAAGQMVQLIAPEVEGQRTATCVFTEKMRAHAIIREMSAFRQKKSQGTFGTIVFRPVCIAAMVGV